MNKEIIKNEAKKDIIVSFGPENVDEINNWYETFYSKTINCYRFVCEKINLLLHAYKWLLFAIIVLIKNLIP